MGRCFGSSGRIVATGFGSHGIADPPIELGSARLLVNLAGPTAGFAVLLVVFGVVLAFDSRMAWEQLYWFFSDCGIPIRIEIEMPFGAEPFIEVVLRYLFLISFGWSIWSLLPIWPLDGGRILFEVCETRSGYSGAIGSMMISATVALMAVAFTLVSLRNDPGLTLSGRWQFGAIWFAMLLIHNFFMMEVVRRQRSRYEALHDDPIEAVADEA
ncbi:MAG TPA: M50 family metallopeptidase [Gemmataceae bacterium]|nr:M50 family metallopeptidase [Gemmataceae bacterium]